MFNSKIGKESVKTVEKKPNDKKTGMNLHICIMNH